MMAEILRRQGHEVADFGDPHEAVAYVGREHADLVVTDLRMEGMTGTDLLAAVHKTHPNLPVIVVTGFGSVDAAVDAIKRGAFDFVTKPVTEAELKIRIDHALERMQLSREIRELKRRVRIRKSDLIIGDSPPIHEIFKQIGMVAKSDVAVAVSGESGTGKELVARTIHAVSPRSDGPFVVVNCGALPAELLENELFGHLRGAFTGAVSNQQGLLKAANGGTLFIDEIGELSASMQVKLLRFLQNHEYKPIGGPRTETADLRVITATNRDLSRAVQEGSFREDLYYRINVVPIRVPPLRERKDDIPLLVNHFVSLYKNELKKQVDGFSPAALRKLMEHSWPGNIRELQNVVKKTLVMTTASLILPDDLALPEPGTLGSVTAEGGPRVYRVLKQQVLERFEREYVTRLLEEQRGNVAAAAREAGLDRKNFWVLVRRAGLDAKEFRRRR